MSRDTNRFTEKAAMPETVAQARRAFAKAFRAAGLATPQLDARVLAGHALTLDHAALAAQADRVISDDEMHAMNALAARRLAGEPVARIVGVKEFWGLPIAVNAATLVPRPETETIVEAALATVSNRVCSISPIWEPDQELSSLRC
jgi:release factor glutamine methyltransferase